MRLELVFFVSILAGVTLGSAERKYIDFSKIKLHSLQDLSKSNKYNVQNDAATLLSLVLNNRLTLAGLEYAYSTYPKLMLLLADTTEEELQDLNNYDALELYNPKEINLISFSYPNIREASINFNLLLQALKYFDDPSIDKDNYLIFFGIEEVLNSYLSAKEREDKAAEILVHYFKQGQIGIWDLFDSAKNGIRYKKDKLIKLPNSEQILTIKWSTLERAFKAALTLNW